MLRIVGDKLKVLHLCGSHPPQDVVQSQPWIGALARNGAMLCKLDVIDLENGPLVEAVLGAVQGRVQCLSVRGEFARHVNTHFVRPQELHLSVLKDVSKDMWEALGPSLESSSNRIVMPHAYKDAM